MGCIQKLHGAAAEEQGKPTGTNILPVNDVSDTNFYQLNGIPPTVHGLLTAMYVFVGSFCF